MVVPALSLIDNLILRGAANHPLTRPSVRLLHHFHEQADDVARILDRRRGKTALRLERLDIS